jgi:hypothetical protein
LPAARSTPTPEKRTAELAAEYVGARFEVARQLGLVQISFHLGEVAVKTYSGFSFSCSSSFQ